MSKEEDVKKETLDEILTVVDEHLAEIRSKLDDMYILLFLIALPTIIGIILIALFLGGVIAFPWKV